MLHDILMKVLEMSLIGCYSVLIVMVARGLLWKCERKYAYYLWLIVFLNFSLPFSVKSSFSLIPAFVADFSMEKLAGAEGSMGWEAGDPQSGQEIQQGDPSEMYAEQRPSFGPSGLSGAGQSQEEQLRPDQGNGVVAEKDGVIPSQEVSAKENPEQGILYPDRSYQENMDESMIEQGLLERMLRNNAISDKRLSLRDIPGMVWILGIILILSMNAVGYLRLKKHIHKGRILSLDKEHRIKVVDSVQTALVCGMIRPWVYLPAGMTEEEKAYITAHEQYHRKRRDYLLKAAALCITAVHWFNPLAWIALLLFCQDMEVSCDEKVLEHTSGQMRKQYAASLLKFAARQNGFLVTSLNFGKPALESRIRNVLKEKKKSILITVAAVIGVLAVAMGLFLRPISEEAAENGENRSLSDDGAGTSPASNGGGTQFLDLSKAIEISLDQNATEVSSLLEEDFSLMANEETVDEEKGIYSGINTCVMNREYAFYIKVYYELMAQHEFMSEIYSYNMEWDKALSPHQSAMRQRPQLLYQTAEGVWLNELQANDQYLFWVEYGHEDGQTKVCQYELETGEFTYIAACEWGENLSVSETYVIWYDRLDDGSTEIRIYDIRTQNFKEIATRAPGDILSGTRVDLTENGIAYFSQDEEGNIYVNRYDLGTQETYTLLLGPEKVSEKLTDCFSNAGYIVWSTLKTDRAHGSDTYYFYNMKSGELYRWNGSGEMYATCTCTSRFFSVLDLENKRIFVYDLQNKHTLYQDLDKENTFLPWTRNQDGNVYYESHAKDEIKLYSVDFVYACTDSIAQGEAPWENEQ